MEKDCPVKFSSEYLSFSSKTCLHLPFVVHGPPAGLSCHHGEPSQLLTFPDISGASCHPPMAQRNLRAVATCFFFSE